MGHADGSPATVSPPVEYGIVTAETLDQAIERAGTKAGNKGFDAAMTALEMIDLWKAIDAG